MATTLGETVVKSIFLTIFIVLAIGGNILVCVAIRLNKRLRTLTNYYVFNLAIADLLFGLTGMPLLLVTSIAGKWILGPAMCQLSGVLTTLFVLVSIWTLSLIGVNRYFAVGRPNSYKSTYKKKRVLISIGCVWGLAFVVAVAPVLGWSRIRQGDNFCTIDGKKDISYSIFIILMAYLCPLVILVSLYSKIFFILREHEKTMAGMRGGAGSIKGGHSEAEFDSIDYSSSGKGNTNSLPRDVKLDANSYAKSNNTVDNKQIPNRNGTGGELNANTKFQAENSNGAAQNPDQDEVPRNGDLKTAENTNHREQNEDTHEALEDRSASGSGIHLMTSSDTPGTPSVTYNIDPANSDSEVARKTRSLSGFAKSLKIKRSRSSKKLKKFLMEARVTKMLFVVVAFFFICWTPLVIGTILYAFNAEPKNFNILSLGIVVSCMNSIVNPIIYAFMNQMFRKAFKDLLIKCGCKANDSGSFDETTKVK